VSDNAPDSVNAPDPLDLPPGLLADVLSALLLDVPERAMELLDAAALDDGLRARLRSAVQGAATPAGRAEALGDQLRARGRWLDPDVIECYRAAFYIGDDWEAQLDNPLFARFAAKRGGLPFDKWPHYFDIYRRTLAPYVGTPARVLEIGVFHGGGLDQLRALLGPQAVLVGMDVDPSAEAACAGRFDVAVGDQSDPEFLTSVVERFGPFDVIIDDGGHTMAQQITSVECLFPTLNDGGVYLVEDTHTSYWEPFQDADQTFMEWAKARLDDINAYHFSRDAELSVWTTSVTGIHVYDSIVVLDKARHQPPFCEVAGSGSFVYADRLSESALLSYRASLDTRTMELRQAQEFAAAALTDRQEAVDFGLAADDLRTRLSDEVEKLRAELAAERERAAEERAQLTAEAHLAEAERQRALVAQEIATKQLADAQSSVRFRMSQQVRRLRR
jgi:hypothetical protein